ncbi:MAG: hypothetical protein ACK55Z_22645 [bacterium]
MDSLVDNFTVPPDIDTEIPPSGRLLRLATPTVLASGQMARTKPGLSFVQVMSRAPSMPLPNGIATDTAKAAPSMSALLAWAPMA